MLDQVEEGELMRTSQQPSPGSVSGSIIWLKEATNIREQGVSHNVYEDGKKKSAITFRKFGRRSYPEWHTCFEVYILWIDPYTRIY